MSARISSYAAVLVYLGAKTTRGYGQVSLEVYKKEIKTVEEYIDFDNKLIDTMDNLRKREDINEVFDK